MRCAVASPAMKILVADDDEACRNLFLDMYAGDISVELTMARDGAEAWWLLTDPTRKFDLCIVDLKMPVVDGLQFIERVRGVITLRHLPIILCTGVSDRETVARAARLGITSYIVKPYNPQGMREKIRLIAA
jgi:two-component system, chemotaxis family, chemotaxis protein CheY